ncbi:MAG: hypothetical protein JWM89_1679 [Acidimicrobiales bacterium]|nr:hypothetical protein [Acidimicrobiales bacterium]
MTLSPAFRSDVLAAGRLAASVPGGAPGSPSEDRLEALEQLLYTDWFAHAGTYGADRHADESGWPTLTARLRAAHAATPRLEPGWTAVSARPDGVAMAMRAGEYVEITSGDFVDVAHPGTPLRMGAALAVSRRRDVVNGDGWWVTSASIGPAPERDLVRVYWNCPVVTAPSLVGLVTELMEGSNEPYTLKCPVAGALFDRVDSCVLYLGLEAWRATQAGLRHIHDRLSHRLRPTIPPLTLALGPGAALAEDPGNGQSFGQSRVHAVADGLLTAASRGVVDDAAVLDVVTERLLANGIDPVRPYQAIDSTPERLAAW